jgi:glycosyltransferase involved in cell wall biosynthesis
MKFSIITPTHSIKNIPNLLELYHSIKEQTYSDWEWIILLNGDFEIYITPIELRSDPRVKINRINGNNTNIGFIKKYAFSLGTGDVLVEADHDDLLTPNCLEELYKAYQDESVGFVYSDDAMLDEVNNFVPYDTTYGWTYRTFDWKDKKLIAMNSFAPSSQSLSFIWFAPDHVRSWRRTVYEEIGGHNPDYNICDDHEILIRTYLKTKMHHIPEVLYIYRITGDNTSINHRNEQIQIKTKELFNQYAFKLAEKDCEDKVLLKVDLGGSINPLPGYTTVDQFDADIICDLNDGIPLEDNSVGVINASHVLEHLKDPIKSMREIHRVLCHGGWCFIEVPSTDGRGAFQDPTHVSFWNENSFLYYTNKNLAKYIRNDTIRFQAFRTETWYPNEWLKSIQVNVVTAWMSCVKEDKRLPGLLLI